MQNSTLKTSNTAKALSNAAQARVINPFVNNGIDKPAEGQQFTGTELHDIMVGNGLGTWKFNLHTQQISLCPIAATHLGFNPNASLSLHTIMRQLVQYNAGNVLQALRAACRTQSRVEEVISINTGQPCDTNWLKITGSLFYANGLPLNMMGTITDISLQKNDENRRADLMAFLNHELRTPLSTAKLYIQHAYKVARTEKSSTIADSLMKADHQTVRMASMIENFLTLSRMEVTQLQVQTTRFDMTALLEEMVTDAAIMYPNHTFKIELAKPIMVEADRDKITQVLNNYITNAVKYSPAGSAISISGKQQRGKIKVAVTDEGPGISAANQQQLFNRYCRVHNQTEIRAKGFGLGLFLSREIIEAHGGAVWVKSLPGKGSSFGFTLASAAQAING